MNKPPTTTRAVAINRFGGVDQLSVQTLPIPPIDADDVLVKLTFAGVGVWDPYEREGGFDGLIKQMTGKATTFPLVIGSEGAGTIAAVGSGVKDLKIGDRVYAAAFLNAKGGLYADYAVVKADVARPIPGGLTDEQAAVFGGDAATALRGLTDVLNVKAGESVLIFGAGGGLGHPAVQLAKRLGARVFAVASGEDGVALAKKIGADAVVNGRKDDVLAAARAFAPGGIDAALFTAGGPAADTALEAVRDNGRAAYPNGVEPAPKSSRQSIKLSAFDGNGEGEILGRLDALVNAGPFVVNVARTFPLAAAADAHRFLDEHYLGKIALKID